MRPDPYIEAGAEPWMTGRQADICSPRPRGGQSSLVTVSRIVARSLALSGCLVLAAVPMVTAQSTSGAQSTTSPAPVSPPAAQKTKAGSTATANPGSHSQPVHPHRRRHRKEKAAAPVVPPAPPAPVVPANQPPQPATVAFRGGDLRIDANNSSLLQILNEVSRATGLSIDGLSGDERVYGQYGPGPVTSTLSKLLDGAGYNFVIVGGGPGKAATKLLLTGGPSGDSVASSAGTPAPSFNSAPAAAPAATPDADAAPQDPTEPVHPKTPQEIFNEMRRMHPQK